MRHNTTKVPTNVLKNVKCRTQREFKALKRKQVRAAYQQIQATLLLAAVYTPEVEGDDVRRILRRLARLQDAWSVKNWGR